MITMCECVIQEGFLLILYRTLVRPLDKGKSKDRLPSCFEAITISRLIQEVSTKLKNLKKEGHR